MPVKLSPEKAAGVRASLSDLISLQAEANHLMQANYRETVGGAILFYSLNDQLGSDSRISNASIGAGLFMRVNDALIPHGAHKIFVI